MSLVALHIDSSREHVGGKASHQAADISSICCVKDGAKNTRYALAGLTVQMIDCIRIAQMHARRSAITSVERGTTWQAGDGSDLQCGRL